VGPHADLLIVNARPWTDGGPLAGADTIAVAAGRILAVGRRSEVTGRVGPRARWVDAGGATVTPALTDAHIHMVAWARSRASLELFDCRSREAALARVADFLSAHPGTGTVVGRGWDANVWAEPPTGAALDRVTDDRPVLLHSKDFHSLWVNHAALVRAGVTRATPDPPGGRFERDASGAPSGIVREHATRAFAGLAPSEGTESDLARLRDATRALHAEGVTSIHDFEGEDEEPLLRSLALERGPRLRVLMHVRHAGLERALGLGLRSGMGDDRFRTGALKLFADGTLGSQTAALLQPYEGGTDRGLELLTPEELTRLVARAEAGGLATAIHAIGDRAVRAALDAFASAGPSLGRLAQAPRIEHVQLLDPADRPRFAALGVVASMQPLHCTSDIDIAHRHWGARVERAYPWRSLLASGARLVFGSDAPVEPPATCAALHSAVTRQRVDGTPRGGFVPEECLPLDQALAAYTEWPARLAGAWPRLGRIAAGATADLAIWSADLHRLAPAGLAGARVTMTVLEGEVVFERDPAEASTGGVDAPAGGRPTTAGSPTP